MHVQGHNPEDRDETEPQHKEAEIEAHHRVVPSVFPLRDYGLQDRHGVRFLDLRRSVESNAAARASGALWSCPGWLPTALSILILVMHDGRRMMVAQVTLTGIAKDGYVGAAIDVDTNAARHILRLDILLKGA
jgi:hypothetical protein